MLQAAPVAAKMGFGMLAKIGGSRAKKSSSARL
jgi:hypothetical protein